MASSPEVLEYLHIRLRMAKDRKLQDQVLDIILENETHATEWDAVQWGFSVRWMAKELKQMASMRICPECGMDH